MTQLPYTIKSYGLEDLDRLIQFRDEVEKHGQNCIRSTPHDLIEGLGMPNRHPEDNLFIAEREDKIVGYMDVMPEMTIRRAVLNCLIHPRYDRVYPSKGLIERALNRSKELRLKRAHVNIAQGNVRAEEFFSKTDFRLVRRYLQLRLDLVQAHLASLGKTALSLRPLREGEQGKLTQIQNRSFIHTWGYNPNTVEEIRCRIGLPNCSPSDIIMAYDKDKPIGYCWTRIYRGQGSAQGGAEGCISMLGVDPDHRGKGVGSAVLAAGLSLLRTRGVRIVQLTVDSRNRAARTLYRAAGFEVWKTNLWYEKDLG